MIPIILIAASNIYGRHSLWLKNRICITESKPAASVDKKPKRFILPCAECIAQKPTQGVKSELPTFMHEKK